MTAPQGEQTQNWYSNVNATQRPDYGGVMSQNNNYAAQAQAGMRDPNSFQFNTQYQPTNFQVNPLQFNDPLAGYNGGGPGMQVQAPGGVSGNASDYQVNYDRVSAPTGVQAERISGLPQVTAPQLQQYQMGPAQQVQAPGGLSSFQIAQGAQPISAQQIGAPQSWTSPGTAQQFMSPYTQQVLDAQKANVNADYAAQLTQQHSQAAQAGAFGGSRQAVQDAELNRNQNLQLQNIEAQGLQSAYGQGMQQFNTQQQMGMQGQLANQQAGLQASLANQGTQQQTSLANQQAALAAQGLGTNAGLQAALANQQAGLTVGGQNLQALLGVQALGGQLGMQAQQLNQQTALQSALANQSTGLQAGMFNNQQNMQGQLANQAAGIQTGLAAQQMGLQGGMFNGQQSMQAQQLNQQAQQNQYNRMFQGLGMQYQGGMQAGLQGQNLGMQAQQNQMANNQFGANFGQNQQNQLYQLQQAQQGLNLGNLNFAGNMNMQNAGLQTQGFNNQMAWNNQVGQTAQNQQQYDQAAADRAYQDWLRQQNYPMQMVSWGAGIASQFPQQGAVQSTQQGNMQQTTPNPSIFNQVMGGLGTFAGAGMKAAGMARGGVVDGDDDQSDGWEHKIVPFIPLIEHGLDLAFSA